MKTYYRLRWQRTRWEYGSNDFKNIEEAETIISELSKIKGATYRLTKIEEKEICSYMNPILPAVKNEQRILTI